MTKYIISILTITCIAALACGQTSQIPLDISDGFNFDAICGPGQYAQCKYDATQDFVQLFGDMSQGVGHYIPGSNILIVSNNSNVYNLSYSIPGGYPDPLYLSGTDGIPTDGVLTGEKTYHIASLFGNSTLTGNWIETTNPAAFEILPNVLAVGSPHNKNDWQIAGVTVDIDENQQDYYDNINFIINGFYGHICRNMQIVAVYTDSTEQVLYSFPTDTATGPIMTDPDSYGTDFSVVYNAAYRYDNGSGATGAVRGDNSGSTFFEFASPLQLDNTRVLCALRFEDVNPDLNWAPRGMAIWAATAEKTDTTTNNAPYANAGNDQNITDSDEDGSEAVYLDASASTDTDGKILSAVWSENSAIIAAGITPAVTLDLGLHDITLTVTDDNGDTSTDTVAINIEAPGEGHPVADAGSDQTLLDENNSGDESVTLDGSASYDPNGTIVSYVWSEAGSAIATGVNPTITLTSGIHDLRLTVTDNDGLVRYDSVTVRVIDWRQAQTYHVAKDGNDTNDGSEENPLLTLGQAVSMVNFGDTIIVHEGIYREGIRFEVSGLPGYPITLTAAENEDVVISGAREVSGWSQCSSAAQAGGNANYANIWTKTVSWEPENLYQDNTPVQIARTPGWMHPSDGGTATTIYDPANLGQGDDYWAGARAVVWIYVGTAHYHVDVLGSTADTLTIEAIGHDRTPDAEDYYYLSNKVQLIDDAGQWASEDNGDGTYTLYLWPDGSIDPNTSLIEASTNDFALLVDWSDESWWIVNGFEMRHGEGYGIGGYGPTSTYNTVSNCCIHHMGNVGIYGRYNRNGHYHHNYVGYCSNGVTISENNVLFEFNEVESNQVDGVIIGGDNVTVRDNLIHHQNGEGHCDNIQSFDNSTGGRVENLFLQRNMVYSSGQTYMMAQVYDPVFDSNVFMGSTAYMLIFGHESCDNATITSNTMLLSGYGLLNTSGCLLYSFSDNVFYHGKDGASFGMPQEAVFTSDYNLYYTADNEAEAAVNYITWAAPLATWQSESGQGANSLYGEPMFINAPKHINMVDVPRVTEFTPTKIYMQDLNYLEVGDNIEIDFDGVVRTVTAVGTDYIEFTPAHPKAIEKLSMVCNWKDNTDFTYDLALQTASPGYAAASDSGNIGTPIDTVSYMQADFDGDGQADIKRWPIEDAAPQPLPGDADLDGDVDISDFLILKSNYGTATGATWQMGDFDGDQDVDISDFLILKANYGAHAGQAGS